MKSFCDIYMCGRLAGAAMAQYRLQVKMLVSAKRNVTIDLRGAEQVGQAFWQALGEWLSDVSRYGGELRFVCVPPWLREQFADRGLLDLILE